MGGFIWTILCAEGGLDDNNKHNEITFMCIRIFYSNYSIFNRRDLLLLDTTLGIYMELKSSAYAPIGITIFLIDDKRNIAVNGEIRCRGWLDFYITSYGKEVDPNLFSPTHFMEISNDQTIKED